MAAEENKKIVDAMYESMNLNQVGAMKKHWTRNMVWDGPAGIGKKHGVEQFEEEVRRPFIHAFPDKVGEDIVRLFEGDWVAGTGFQDATFAHDWLGIPGTGKRVRVRYMDFWRIEEEDGERKLAENFVLIDILGVLEQAGYDVKKVLQFVGSKPPEFFENISTQSQR
ncbi:ester cyclase [Candidatus Leptofilum sp.]|uniref:ester cyclase n=1 Tax=Candidatus Leptofilum sp. TaxID=3241576 RepID=UPI003B5C9A06